jgi:hypothetical protein
MLVAGDGFDGEGKETIRFGFKDGSSFDVQSKRVMSSYARSHSDTFGLVFFASRLPQLVEPTLAERGEDPKARLPPVL